MSKTKKERDLEADWQKVLATHSKPLERGAKAKGVRVAAKAPIQAKAVVRNHVPGPLPARFVNGSGTKPAVDPLAEAKRNIAHRVGQAYNKGGIVLLTDDEIKEQRTGSHLRR